MAKAATRDGYGNGLLKIGGNKDVVVLDAGVSDSTRSEKFKEKYPERFFNMGISEMDMVGTAAGFAKCGKIPFASSFASFLMGRTQDHQLVSVAYSESNVKLIASHAGVAIGEDGPTAQAVNDVGMARAMPTMIVIEPADAVEAEKVVEFLVGHKGPAYVRLGRPEVETIYDDSYKFKLGKASLLKGGGDAAIIASGIMVQESLKAAELLKNEGIEAAVVNMSSIKPIDEKAIVDAAKTGVLIAAQDHNIYGGLGDAVAAVIAKKTLDVKFDVVGIKDGFAESDSQEVLFKKYGMDSEAIANAVKKAVSQK
ncbi:transketolase family protein [Candidatus Woesearchaeota archaeon]|nr:transketolase family protein [Candidatus Woesearchaeota archaeon]